MSEQTRTTMTNPDIEVLRKGLEGAKVLTQGPSWETQDAAMVNIFKALHALSRLQGQIEAADALESLLYCIAQDLAPDGNMDKRNNRQEYIDLIRRRIVEYQKSKEVKHET